MGEAPEVLSIDCFRCTGCGNVTFLPKKVCPKCWSTEIEAISCEGKGKLVNYATIYFPPDNYKGMEPYTVGLVRLDSGCGVLGIIRGADERIVPDAPVVVSEWDKEQSRLIFNLT